MKKKLAAMLCGLMCVTGFSGCSDTELDYLHMSSDMLHMMSTCKVSGQMQMDADLDAMQDFVLDVAEAANVPVNPLDMNDLTGKKSATLDYVMQMDLDTLEYDMAFDVTYEGKQYDLGKLYYSLTDGIYVTTDTLLGLYAMVDDLTEGYGGNYFFSDAYEKDLKAALAQEEYVELVSMEDLTGLQIEEALPQDGFGALYDAVFTFYEDVLDGFETGLVKKTSDGYVMKADGHAVAQLFVDLLDFVAANPEQVLDATEVYMMTIAEQSAMTTEEKAAMQELFAEMKASQSDMVETVNGISSMLQMMLQEESVAMVLDSFSYDAVVKKTLLGIDSEENIAVTHDNKTVFSVATKAKAEKTFQTPVFPTDGLTVDGLQEKLNVLEDKYNPVTGVVLSWGWEDTNTMAMLDELRVPSPFSQIRSETTELIVKDGRAYLPLRMICDALGETVTWNNAEKTAYVVQDGQNIPMKGLLQDGKSYVSVRDFEKLGYTVTYSNVDGMKEAVIER